MRTVRSSWRKWIALILIMTGISISSSLAQTFPPEPEYRTADVDGDPSEWVRILPPNGGSQAPANSDFFAYLYRAARPYKPEEAALFVRYDCATKTLYVYVEALCGLPIITKNPYKGVYYDDHFIKIGDGKSTLVTAASGDDGHPPDFRWVGLSSDGKYAKGWEASIHLEPGSYTNFNVHTQVYDDREAQTAAVEYRAIELEISCEVDECVVNPLPEWKGEEYGMIFENQTTPYLKLNFHSGAKAIGFYNTKNIQVYPGVYTGGAYKAVFHQQTNRDWLLWTTPPAGNTTDFSFEENVVYEGQLFRYLIRYTGSGMPPSGDIYIKTSNPNPNADHGISSWYLWMQDNCDKVSDVDPVLNLRALAAEDEEVPGFRLKQNYPNPFNTNTVIEFSLPVASDVRLEVFDLAGRKVRTIVSGQLAAGNHQVPFDAGDLASGTYMYRISTPGFTKTQFMTLVK